MKLKNLVRPVIMSSIATAKRPLLLRMLPPRLRMSAWARLYRPTPSELLPLYEDAPLYFAPRLRMKLVPGDPLCDSVALTGLYDPRLSRMVLKLAARGGLMVDVGANLGLFSLLWASVRTDNRVIAFEPSSRVLPLLRENIERNDLAGQIEVRAEAAGAETGTAAFEPGPEGAYGWGRFAVMESDRTSQTVEVPAVRLDDSLAGCGPISLLKIDAEGFDGYVIKGSETLLRSKQVRHVWMEEYIYVLGRVLLREFGYSFVQYGENCHATPSS
jgi:FkbM family methyltransferase